MVTISNQSHYDVTVQAYGGLDDIGKILSEMSVAFDINKSIPFNTVINLVDTQDPLAIKFRVSGIKIATGEEEIPYVAGLILQEQSDIILQEQTDNISQE